MRTRAGELRTCSPFGSVLPSSRVTLIVAPLTLSSLCNTGGGMETQVTELDAVEGVNHPEAGLRFGLG